MLLILLRTDWEIKFLEILLYYIIRKYIIQTLIYTLFRQKNHDILHLIE